MELKETRSHKRTRAASPAAQRAFQLVEALQQTFADALTPISQQRGDGKGFAPVEWLRDEGRNGGGIRFVAADQQLFNRASVNVSQIHYDNLPNKALGSASALSCIIHPNNPYAPSMHMHISWTQMKNGAGYWRMMADLNPAIEHPPATAAFSCSLRSAAPKQYAEANKQGERYFHIPALSRHRGVSHFYLENFSTDDPQADFELANTIGKAVIQAYCTLLNDALIANPNPDTGSYQQQLAYHTLYLFQVLTLDRGTTSGLLVHNQNDVGILGSLPSHIDRDLLASWKPKLDAPQDQLLGAILNALPAASPCPVNDNTKQAIAECVRTHYRTFPDALAMQASGATIPPTVDNHR
ncbi:MAG: coproporphyrinogen III oxidase [Pseudomonadales bacterium]|nr:coproporphyrinogen III oxidase [Pseudomonadales bacterium]